MKSFPLIRKNISNEKIMTLLFIVLLLYLFPRWIEQPITVLWFMIVLSAGLAADTISHLVHHKKVVCAVSAAVTTAIIFILLPQASLVLLLGAVLTAILLGKQLFGGTGKNPLNPALVGVVLAGFFSRPLPNPFVPSVFMTVALALSLLFLFFRPWAGLGLGLAMLLFLAMQQKLDWNHVMMWGIPFWAGLIITDPVTSTPRPFFGLAGAFAAGFGGMFLHEKLGLSAVISLSSTLLVFNGFSYLIERLIKKSPLIQLKKIKIGNIVPHSSQYRAEMIDLTGSSQTDPIDLEQALPGRTVLLEQIKKADISGRGGAGFAFFKKLNTLLGCGASQKYLLINGAECDPGLIHDQWLLSQFSTHWQKGIEILKQIVSFDRIIVAVKKDVPSLKLLPGMEVIQVPDFYPVGYEKILIRQVLGIKLDHEQIPAQQGILVYNLQTMYALCQIIYGKEHEESRFITVADLTRKKSCLVKVKKGMLLSEVIKTVYPGQAPVFSGGGAMQVHQVTRGEEVTETTNFIARSDYPYYKESPLCSKCNLCNQVCPVGLAVDQIAHLVEQDRLEQAVQAGANQCIACGLCSYLCLAGKDLCSKVKKARRHGGGQNN